MGRMTHAMTAQDFELEESAHASDGPSRKVLSLLFFGLIALLVGADVTADALEGTSLLHAFLELAAMGVAIIGLGLLVRDLTRARAHSRELTRKLAASHRDAERYRHRAQDLLRGLAETIDEQLGQWGLTAAEKEVALLLLKGLSHKEIAVARNTSERTARKQALAIYKKASLDGRAALSAFFLEDLLTPRERASVPGGS